MSKKSIIKARAMLALMLVCGGVFFSLLVPSRDLGNSYTMEEFSLKELEMLAMQNGTKPDRNDVYVAHQEQPNVILSHYVAGTQWERPRLSPPSAEEVARLSDFGFLTRNIFLEDPRTKLLRSDIDVPAFLAMDFRIDTTVDGPQVLIFHAHSMEMFEDSNPADPFTGVMGVGRLLAEILETRHGLQVLHYTERFDMLNGVPMRPGSYERLEPVIRQILADNPSIQVVIDLHRDGVEEHVAPMVTYIDGQRTARIMLVNGLSRRYRNGVATPINYLPNPYLRENLAFSLNLQVASNQLFPGFARRVYLHPFRLSLHMAPRSILLEVGAQNNTFQEALNAMPAVADIIAAIVLDDEYSSFRIGAEN